MSWGEPRKVDFARQVAAAAGYVALCGFDRVSVIPFPNAQGRNAGRSETSNAEHRTSNIEQSVSEGALRSVRVKKYAMQFFQSISGMIARGGADVNDSLRRGA